MKRIKITPTESSALLGHRILCRDGGGAYEDVVKEVSPSGKFIRLNKYGWCSLESLKILDILEGKSRL